MKMYAVEHQNTRDGSLNFQPSNILNRQLTFTRELHPYQREHGRWVEYDTEDDYADVGVKRKFEKKYNVVCKFEAFADDAGFEHRGAWVIYEKKKLPR